MVVRGVCDHGTIVVSFWVGACCCIAFATLSKEKFLFLEAGRFMMDYSGAGAFVSVCSLECTAGGLTDVFLVRPWGYLVGWTWLVDASAVIASADELGLVLH